MGLIFTIAYRVGLGCLFSAWPGCGVGTEEMALPAGLTVSDLGVAFLWGFALHHYYLDQRIWHVRHDPGLSHDLRLQSTVERANGQAAPPPATTAAFLRLRELRRPIDQRGELGPLIRAVAEVATGCASGA